MPGPASSTSRVGFVAMTELQRIDWNGPTLILVRPL